jgi:hypothetical protein
MDSLYSFAVSDDIKYLLYKNFDMRDVLRKIIYNGNKSERESAFKLLYQLCFDDKISTDIKEDTKLYELIQKTENSKTCKGILMVIDSKKETENFQNKYIMISYQKKSREICLAIKKELEKSGKKVWIDVENIDGSDLYSIAKAIEEAECVLVCMSEFYKASANCRAEAEYTITLGKPVMFIIVQKEYR